MSYKITITRVTENVPFKNKDYEVVGKKDDGENEYGYVYYDDTKTVIKDIFEQTVEDLDVQQVVAVVNKIGDK